MPAVPLRTDFDAAMVRRAATTAKDPAQVRRLLAVAAVYDGMNRQQAATVGGMDRQTLRDWVHRFNAEGPAGLVDRKAPGAARRLTPAQLLALGLDRRDRPRSGDRRGGALAADRSSGGDQSALRRRLS